MLDYRGTDQTRSQRRQKKTQQRQPRRERKRPDQSTNDRTNTALYDDEREPNTGGPGGRGCRTETAAATATAGITTTTLQSLVGIITTPLAAA